MCIETQKYVPENSTLVLKFYNRRLFAISYYDVHCTMFFNNFNICILTRPLHMCDI
jgi:hypothetical protein